MDVQTREASPGLPNLASTSAIQQTDVSVDLQHEVSHGHSPPADTLNQSEVDSIIRKKRKQREYKACYPCRSRKVKCDQQIPCKSCVDRQHPEFCTYHPPSEGQSDLKRLDTGARHGEVGIDIHGFPLPSPAFDSLLRPANPANGASEEVVTISKAELDSLVNRVQTLARALQDAQASMQTSHGQYEIDPGLDERRQATAMLSHRNIDEDTSLAVSQATAEGLHTQNELGETIHIGGNSVPALVLELGKRHGENPEVSEMLNNNILPIFGLENETATYPFVSLWDMPTSQLTRMADLAKAIPNDQECRDTVCHYRDHAYVLFPAIADFPKFEAELAEFLTERARLTALQILESGITEDQLYGKGLYWIGLLFATLACGSQSMPGKRRIQDLASQVFVCCSFECLRLTNFFSHSTLHSIQTLLVLGNVISNNMNAGVAWVLLGLTIRLAKGLGLHQRCPASASQEVRIIRSKVWWSVIWQDSLLSITYDRATSNSSMGYGPQFPATLSGAQGGWTYNECMYRLCRVGMNIIRERSTSQEPQAMMRHMGDLKAELDNITSGAADYLKESRYCNNKRERMQHWTLYMHVSYVGSELCRPALTPSVITNELSQLHRKNCIDSLVNCVDAFMGLNEVTPFASKSWAAMHRALSSALLLCILREPSKSERARTLVERLVQLLHDITADVDVSDVAAPIKRSMLALTKLINARPGKLGAVRFPPKDLQRAIAPAPLLPKRTENASVRPSTATSLHAGSSPMASSTMSPTSQQRVGVVAQGQTELNLNGLEPLWDSPTMSGIIPLMGGQEDSPYAMMEAIFWGQRNSPLGV